MKRIFVKAALLAFMASAHTGIAATGDIPFSGGVSHTCTITVNSGGTLGVRPDFKVLRSDMAGGSPGTATVVATGNGFTIDADTPSGFDSKPAADTTPDNFVALYRSSGATTLNNTQIRQSLNHGTSNVEVTLIAYKTGSDVYEAGSYAATVVLRCE